MTDTLAGKLALVTGCARRRGLGRAIALELAGAGADVVVADVAVAGHRNLDEPADPAEHGWGGLVDVVGEIEALGRRGRFVVGDVGRRDDVERMVAGTLELAGRIDILVNNAGAPQGADRGWTWEVPEPAFAEVVRINTKGVFLLSAAVARHLVERAEPGGRIVNIASIAGRQGFPQRAAYCVSKFGVIALTEVMALELAPHGATVNAICPGSIDTSRQAARAHRAASGGAGSETTTPPPAPVGRLGSTADIARTALFLAEPAADYITGQSFVIDGGMSLSW